MKGRRAIPPLKALATLECVVRHRSVSLAADELCVTHGAVSKQLTTLAAWIGQPLFADNRRRMVPTAAALRLAGGVETGMRAIYEALDAVRDEADEEPHLRVLAPATLAMYWLIPRLPALRRSALKVKAQVQHTHTHEPWRDLAFDLAIRSDGDVPEAYDRSPLFRDVLGLVAVPELATALSTPDALRHVPLLESETRPGEVDDWLSSAGLSRADVGGTETFEHNYIAIEAALTGQGVIVAPLAVVGNHLARGTLERVMPDVTIPGPEYVAIHDPRSTGARHARAFAGWLRAMATEDDTASAPADRSPVARRRAETVWPAPGAGTEVSEQAQLSAR